MKTKRLPVVVEQWWCRRCDWLYDAVVPSSAVCCPKGHHAKKVTARELSMQRAAEGSVA